MASSNFYKLANQKLLKEIDILDQNIYHLQQRTLKSPCIVITGFDKLHLCTIIKGPFEEPMYTIVQKMFTLLNMPCFWIQTIKNIQGKRNHIPSEVHVHLITDSIKVYVYNTISKYLRITDQKSVTVKLLTH